MKSLRKIGSPTVARAAAREVRRVLGSKKAVGTALARNVKTSRAMKRARRSYRAVAG